MQTEKNLPACPVETTLMLIGDKWKVQILLERYAYSEIVGTFILI